VFDDNIECVYEAGVTAEDVASCESALAGLCAELDPASVPLPDAPAIYEALARIEKLAAGAKLRIAKRVEDSNEWRRGGYRSPAEWLARRSGTSTGAAHGELATSARLAALPGTSEAVRHGALSVVQAVAVAAAATADQSAESRLLRTASRASVRELREVCAQVKASADPDADARYDRIRRERRLRTFTDHEGTWNLTLGVHSTPERESWRR
jgi:Domain of unknown function (DUF222)